MTASAHRNRGRRYALCSTRRSRRAGSSEACSASSAGLAGATSPGGGSERGASPPFPSLGTRAGALDLGGRRSKGAEDEVDQDESGRLAEVRVHVLPDQLSRRRHFEEAAEATLADERVAIGQTLGARDIGAEEVEGHRVPVLPR